MILIKQVETEEAQLNSMFLEQPLSMEQLLPTEETER